MASDYFGVDYCMSTVRPEHGAFYRRVFHFDPMSDVRYYAGLNFPVQAHVADVPKWSSRASMRAIPFTAPPPRKRSCFSAKGGYVLGRFVKASARVAQAEGDQETVD